MLELLRDELGGFLRERRALEEHGLDFLPQRPDAPALGPAQLGVEIALQGVVRRDELLEVAPSQLSRQCSNNLRVREPLSELDHSRHIGPGPTRSELDGQLLRPCSNNHFPILCPFVFEDVFADAPASLPIECHEARIDRSRNLFAGGPDHLPQICQQPLVGQDAGENGRRRDASDGGCGHRGRRFPDSLPLPTAANQ